MKTNILLKSLIDFLFLLMLPGIIAFLFILPFGIFTTNIGNVSIQSIDDVKNLSIFYWLGILSAIITYGCMLFSLYYLKKCARNFLDNNLFKVQVSKNMTKSGNLLIATSLLTIMAYIFIWIAGLQSEIFTISYGNNLFIPIFLAIIGLFFKLISNALNNARILKEENDLTI